MLTKILNKIRLQYLDLSSRTVSVSLSDEKRMELALEWFKNSILKTGGSSAKYSMLFNKWYPAYPETNGFWLNTLIALKNNHVAVFESIFGEQKIIDEVAHWLMGTQRLDGTFPGSYGDYANQPPRVFNNGQIILGLSDYYEHTKDAQTIEACIKSADWLCKVQSADGSWKQFTLHQLSSNTRTAWALIRLGNITGEKKYTEAGRKNIEYALTLQNDKGYFKENGFEESTLNTTHTLAYAVRGVLGAAIELQNDKWIIAVRKTFDSLLNIIKPDGFLPGDVTENFETPYHYCCLTGNCQLSVAGFELYRVTGEKKYADAANNLINYVKTKQLLSEFSHSNGGVSGSWPLNGRYCAYDIPNWAAKFFMDAVILQQKQKTKD